MKRRIGLLAAAAGIAAAVYFLLPAPIPDTNQPAATASLPQSASTAPDQADRVAPIARAPLAGWQIVLLPDAGISADLASVRIGLAFVSDEDMATHLAQTGEENSAPLDAAAFAQVRDWQSLPATVLADGSVRVGPLTLAPADRYVLQAQGRDRLRQYHTNFAAESAPTTLAPLVAAGLRISRPAALEGELSLLLRRTGELPHAEIWQSLLQRHPTLAAAYNDRPLPLAPGNNELAPLPAQPIEALILVDGIEAQRQPLNLVAGQWAELQIDAVAHEVARRLAVELTLQFVVRGAQTPIEALQVYWQHERGERSARTDTRGQVRFSGVDRQRAQQFDLRFPSDDAELPAWPQSRSLSLHIDDLYPQQRNDRQIEHQIELDRLEWLVASSNSVLLDPKRTAGLPYPVYVLQQRTDGSWFDSSAEYFLKIDAGLAVSLTEPGEYRVAAVMTPWTLYFSQSVDSGRGSRNGRHPVRLEATAGRTVDLQVRANGAPLPRAQVLMPGPLRGLPPFERVADNNGRLRLDAVTVDSLLIEVPGYAQQTIDMRAPAVVIELEAEEESVSPER